MVASIMLNYSIKSFCEKGTDFYKVNGTQINFKISVVFSIICHLMFEVCFGSKNGRNWWTYFHPLLEGFVLFRYFLLKLDGNNSLSYIVTKVCNKDP